MIFVTVHFYPWVYGNKDPPEVDNIPPERQKEWDRLYGQHLDQVSTAEDTLPTYNPHRLLYGALPQSNRYHSPARGPPPRAPEAKRASHVVVERRWSMRPPKGFYCCVGDSEAVKVRKCLCGNWCEVPLEGFSFGGNNASTTPASPAPANPLATKPSAFGAASTFGSKPLRRRHRRDLLLVLSTLQIRGLRLVRRLAVALVCLYSGQVRGDDDYAIWDAWDSVGVWQRSCERTECVRIWRVDDDDKVEDCIFFCFFFSFAICVYEPTLRL
ncbi:hypothetical protein C8J57DRAFT_358530 [Mycena rebaudengoi]|nr:hypothetical protein C8J57DRAFT_358530 [Mycena rebaudengoi]